MDVSGRFLAFTLHGAGWVLWMLIALSVMSVAVMLERLWYFRAHRPGRSDLAAEIRTLLRQGGDRGGLARPAEVTAPVEMTAAIE
jgi:biopolymer transport protein ExbB